MWGCTCVACACVCVVYGYLGPEVCVCVLVLCVCVSVCGSGCLGGGCGVGVGFFVGHVSVSVACGVSMWGWYEMRGGEWQAGRQAARVLPLHTVAGLTAGRRRKLDVREISHRQIDSL